MISVSVIIPFYNEKEIYKYFDEILNAINQKPNLIDLTIVFVDDCSNDGSKEFIEGNKKP